LAAYGAWFGDPDASRRDLNIDVFFPRYGLRNPTDTQSVINNAFTNMGAVVLNFHPFNWLAFEGGAGMVKGRHEDNDLKVAAASWQNQMRRWAFYTNLELALVDRHFFIVPEFSFSDLGGGSDPARRGGGKWWASGVKFQIDFN
jgi:hypothetical protein